MLIEHRGSSPSIASSAVVASTAVICGAVTIGERTQILHGAVISAEDGTVSIGADCVVMEHSVIRGRAGHDALIGDSVMIGPHTHLNGCAIGDEAFVATGAALFPGSVLGTGAEVRINGVVQVNTIVAPGTVVPIGWVAVGNPAQLFPADRHDEIWAVQRTLDFTGTVYGVGPGASMRDIMRGQAGFYSAHRDDTELS